MSFNERNELIKLLSIDIECNKDGHGDCSMCEYKYADDKCFKYISELTADFLLANGVRVSPYNVGDPVFTIEKSCLKCPFFKDGDYSDYCECTLDDNKLMFETDFDKDCYYEIIKNTFNWSMLDKIDKTVFSSEEEAKNAIK